MKYLIRTLVGIVGAIITMAILRLLSVYVFTISEFTMGWFACLGFNISIGSYKYCKYCKLYLNRKK